LIDRFCDVLGLRFSALFVLVLAVLEGNAGKRKY
jgi:hypothetical protein